MDFSFLLLCHSLSTGLFRSNADKYTDCVPKYGIFKLSRIPEIDSKEKILPAKVAWRAGTTALILLGSEPP